MAAYYGDKLLHDLAAYEALTVFDLLPVCVPRLSGDNGLSEVEVDEADLSGKVHYLCVHMSGANSHYY